MKRYCLLVGVLLTLGGCAVTDTGNPPLSPPNPDDTIIMSQLGGTVSVQGLAGAVDAVTGLVRVTNLDSTASPVDAPIQPDGSFSASLLAEVDDVLRFQRVEGAQRSIPVDIDASTGEVDPTGGIRCLSVGTTYLDADVLEDTTDFEVLVENDCPEEMPFDVRLRTAGADSTLPITLSLEQAVLAAGASASLTLSVSPPSGSEGEEVVLLAIEGGAARRAVTVRGAR